MSRRPNSAKPIPARRVSSGDRGHQGSDHRSGENEKDFIYNCKAAYLVVFDETTDNIRHKDDLKNVLQQSGRNPSTRQLQKFWKPKRDGMTYSDYLDVCRELPVTTEDDLIKAFRKIDVNGDGYITNNELYKVMTTRGEKMSKQEVQAIIDEVDENGDGKLDYKEFSQMMLNTQDQALKMAKKNLERKEKSRREANRQPVSPKFPKRSMTNGSKSAENTSRHQSERRSFRDADDSSKKMQNGTKEEEEDSDDDDDIVIGSQVSLRSPKPSSRDLSARRSGGSKPDEPKNSARSRRRLSAKDQDSNEDDDESQSQKPNERPKSPVAFRKTKLPEPKRIRDWKLAHSKGGFFFEEDGSIVSHQYGLTLTKSSSVYITCDPFTIRASSELHSGREVGNAPTDTMLMVLRDKPDNEGNIVATFSEMRDSKGKYCVRADLDKGKYRLVPFTTGARFKPRHSEPKVETKLVKKDKDDKFVLTKAFKEALSDIFEICDLDGNGSLNRSEFNWFNLRTSGEDVADEEWEVVEENIDLKNGEITLKGFLELNEMEAEDNQGDTDDLWVTLSSMGYNKGLIMDEACPFNLEVFAEDVQPQLKVIGLGPAGPKLDHAICEIGIGKGSAGKIKNMKDLFLYTYSTDFMTWYIIENKSRSRVTVKVDCSKSKNCVTNRDKLDYSVTIAPKEKVVAHHILPANERQEWFVKCTETVIK